MRIAISQIDTRPGDLPHTTARMAQLSQAAAERGVDLLVFPVTTLTGPTPVSFGDRGPFAADLAHALEDLAARVLCDCLVPVVTMLGELPAVEVLLLRGGSVTPLRLGGRAFGAATAGHVDAALPLAHLECQGSTVGLAFSYEDLDAWCDRPGAFDVLCFLGSYGYAVDDASSAMGSALREGRFLADAKESGAWVVGVGSLGGYGMQVFSGSSFVVAPDGRLAASSPAFEEDLLVADVGRGVELASGEELLPEYYDERYHLWQALVLGLRDYVQKLGMGEVALCLDGTVGSMLTAVIASDALGPAHVHVLLAAARDERHAQDAARLARSLRLDAIEGDSLQGVNDPLPARDLAQVRLAALAREKGALALSTEDKTGFALEGRQTHVSAAGLAPLGDVYRVDVLDVARLRNTISAVFPKLELTQLDVPDVGVEVPAWGCETTLERIDAALASHIEGGYALHEVAEAIGDGPLAEAVLCKLRDGRLFCAPKPPCLALTTRTLFDAGEVFGLAWQDHLGRAVQEPPHFATASAGEASEQAVGVATDAPEAPADEPPFSHEEELREALSLLRDLAQGGAVVWPEPFSEN